MRHDSDGKASGSFFLSSPLVVEHVWPVMWFKKVLTSRKPNTDRGTTRWTFPHAMDSYRRISSDATSRLSSLVTEL
jgi:hypothetical protein